MSYEVVESKFVATEEQGEVSSLLIRPDDAQWLLVLGHGASTDMRHATLQTIAERLADVGVATFRYNFPYAEQGRGRNANAVCQETVRSVVAAAHTTASDLSILVGGHSFSGRMSSMAAAEAPLEHVRGLVFFAFPLHPSGKPSTDRAAHLSDVTIPMLFLSGTRDNWGNSTYYNRPARGLATRQRYIFWTPLTTDLRFSNALVTPTKMCS